MGRQKQVPEFAICAVGLKGAEYLDRLIAANCAPSSLAVIKQQVYADTMRDVFEASSAAEKLMHESMLRPDFIEGITSFFEKRPPNFPPLKEET